MGDACCIVWRSMPLSLAFSLTLSFSASMTTVKQRSKHNCQDDVKDTNSPHSCLNICPLFTLDDNVGLLLRHVSPAQWIQFPAGYKSLQREEGVSVDVAERDTPISTGYPSQGHET